MIKTNMREAFEASLRSPRVNRDMGLIVVKTMAKHQRSGIVSEGSTWNASLSHATYLKIRAVCGLQ